MFPAVEVMVKGLHPDHLYSVSLGLHPANKCRYRFKDNTGWENIGTYTKAADVPLRRIPHPHSRNYGSHFMRQPLSFKTVKMTNHLNTKHNNQVRRM